MMVFVLSVTLLIYKQVGELVMEGTPQRDPNDQGPEVGEKVPAILAYDLDTSEAVDYTPKSELLLFAMPGCPGCEQIAATLPTMAASNPDVPITFLTIFSERDLEGVDSDVRRVRELVLPDAIREEHSRKHVRVLAASSTSEEGPHKTYAITGTPFALLVDDEGRVKSKAALRAVHHLERLVAPDPSTRVDV
jgi:hypothetical protein